MGERGAGTGNGSAPDKKKLSRSPQDLSRLQLGNDGRHDRRPVVREVVGGNYLDGFCEDVSYTLIGLPQEGLQDVGPEGESSQETWGKKQKQIRVTRKIFI